MKDEWVKFCMDMAERKADFYSGARKIIRATNRTFEHFEVPDALVMADCGFTKSKTSMLTRNYLNVESRDAAVLLWKGRLERDKYGSVGFSTYNHLIKGGGLRNPWERASKVTGIPPREGGTMGGRRRKDEPAAPAPKVNRASVMGPCIQGVTLTLLPKRRGTALDVFYRTTELFKKFPADLVFLRDVLLPPFQLSEQSPVETLTMHFANITCHPMYFVTIIPHLDDPIKSLERIRVKDKYFFDWCVKWTARYLVPQYFRGIEKFAQAMRVRGDALARIDKATMRELIPYLKKHHPGYRNDRTTVEEDEE